MQNVFEIEIPKKDHAIAVKVQRREKSEEANVFDLYYCDELCGCIFKNEHNIWIYEPHAHAGLLLDASQIQHLGHEIGEKAYNS
ncbi:hypothetical protein [Mucilaginibacter aquatilis]|uniref:Uncharacterized protein n=1 Tax=Mucilaginibacter aquatilis TaxID=1517760 RepID=A0A6I4ICG4_9SPHI|nr:hypothetical protein [Mucilaginibacter aquatilis]MVN91548.1 hypothetical protein [Mucilaginibacter aquatilis]